MAKQQTFLDKSIKKGAGSELLSVKIVVGERTDQGTVKFTERFVKVKDLNEVEATAKQVLQTNR